MIIDPGRRAARVFSCHRGERGDRTGGLGSSDHRAADGDRRNNPMRLMVWRDVEFVPAVSQ